MHLSRRELITLFLGAPLAFEACRSGNERRLPDGEIVGQSVSLGHLIRDGGNFAVAQDRWQNVSVAIIGGGIAGLTAAWEFKKKGFNDFVLFELEKETGGTAISGKGVPTGHPWGAHYLPVPFKENTELIELLDEMQMIEGRGADGELIVKEQLLCREPEERVFYKGRWYEGLYLTIGASDDDKAQFAAFQKEIDAWINWRDAKGRRAFVVPLERCSDDTQVTDLDKISFADWLRQKGFTSDRLFWYCDYATRDDYGLKADQASAWVGLFYFCSRVRKSGVESQPFITCPEGNGQFVHHFSSKANDNINTSRAVAAVIPKNDVIEIITTDGEQMYGYHCKKAIYAAPMFTAPYVIHGFRDDAPFDASQFQHNAWFVANLHLKDRPRSRFAKDFPLAWDNVFYESPSLGYVNAAHQKGIDYGPTTLTYYYPMCHENGGRSTLFGYSWNDLADICLTDISRAHADIYDLCERLDIMRWGHAMVSPRPNFIWSGIREKAVRPYRNIHFAHTDLSGIALFEEAFYHGLRAVNEIMKTDTKLR